MNPRLKILFYSENFAHNNINLCWTIDPLNIKMLILVLIFLGGKNTHVAYSLLHFREIKCNKKIKYEAAWVKKKTCPKARRLIYTFGKAE